MSAAVDILVVDDEADIRDLVAGILEDEGFSVRVAADSDAALAAIRQAGKEVAVITDRTDVSGGHQLSAFESLAAIPAADRTGMFVAAVSGGKVYRYDEKGEPVKVWEYPPFDESLRQPVLEAIAATKAQLHRQIGTRLGIIRGDHRII